MNEDESRKIMLCCFGRPPSARSGGQTNPDKEGGQNLYSHASTSSKAYAATASGCDGRRFEDVDASRVATRLEQATTSEVGGDVAI